LRAWLLTAALTGCSCTYQPTTCDQLEMVTAPSLDDLSTDLALLRNPPIYWYRGCDPLAEQGECATSTVASPVVEGIATAFEAEANTFIADHAGGDTGRLAGDAWTVSAIGQCHPITYDDVCCSMYRVFRDR